MATFADALKAPQEVKSRMSWVACVRPQNPHRATNLRKQIELLSYTERDLDVIRPCLQQVETVLNESGLTDGEKLTRILPVFHKAWHQNIQSVRSDRSNKPGLIFQVLSVALCSDPARLRASYRREVVEQVVVANHGLQRTHSYNVSVSSRTASITVCPRTASPSNCPTGPRT